MRRADRLFQIIQIMQRQKTVLTARDIAEELEVSPRTIYRDIQDLMSNHVPIRGERGTGYIFEKGYNLPPLMFSEEEIDAVMLGVEWVRANGDIAIQRAAEDVLSKIGAVLPNDRQALTQSLRHVIPKREMTNHIRVSMPVVRKAIRDQVKSKTVYRTPKNDITERVLGPLMIVFFEDVQLLVAWCDLRNDFRNFRMDRFESFSLMDERFSPKLFDLLDTHLKTQGHKN
ncbi:MAG: YafY family transcriptional regulator [Sneathiella sp.]|nr:YafY family transcriptional regulator [Sneathiella sp.]